jgi:hypothetical protein
MKYKKGVIKILTNVIQPEKIDRLSESEIKSIIPLLKNEKTTRDLINFFTNGKPRILPYGSFLP